MSVKLHMLPIVTKRRQVWCFPNLWYSNYIQFSLSSAISSKILYFIDYLLMVAIIKMIEVEIVQLTCTFNSGYWFLFEFLFHRWYYHFIKLVILNVKVFLNWIDRFHVLIVNCKQKTKVGPIMFTPPSMVQTHHLNWLHVLP